MASPYDALVQQPRSAPVAASNPYEAIVAQPRGNPIAEYLREQWKYLISPTDSELFPGVAPKRKFTVPGVVELAVKTIPEIAALSVMTGNPGPGGTAAVSAATERAIIGLRAARAAERVAPPAATVKPGGPLPATAPKLPAIKLPTGTTLNVKIPKPTIPPAAGQPIVGPAQPPAVAKIIEAVRVAKPVRGQQEALYSAERAARFGKAETIAAKGAGEAGYQEQLQVLRGELPKAQFDPPRLKLVQDDIDSLFNAIPQSPAVPRMGDQLIASKGLTKVLSGRLATDNELDVLGKVFGRDFVNAVRSTRTLGQKGLDLAKDMITLVPRALVAGMDMSAPLWQGLYLLPSFPKQWGTSFVKMFQVAGSEKAYKALGDTILNSKRFALADQSGLAMTTLFDPLSPLAREEAAIGLRLLSQVPILGPLARAAERAYAGFLTKFRWDVFNKLIDNAEQIALKQGANPSSYVQGMSRSAAEFVNTATGRGTLGWLEPAAKQLTDVMFSPRLTASTMQTLNPGYYWRLAPGARKEAVLALGRFAAAGIGVLNVVKMAGGDVVTDPLRADFGSAIVGQKTRLNLLGPMAPYIRLLAVMATGETTSTRTGETKALGKGYRARTRKDVAVDYLLNKAAPGLASAVRDILAGQGPTGQPLDDPMEIAKRFMPMFAADTVEAAREDPEALPFLPLAFFGAKYSTFTDFPHVVRPRMPRVPRRTR